MEFLKPAPGHLTVESGSYYMDWTVSPSLHCNYTPDEVAAMVGSVLGDPRGWERAGLTARRRDDAR